MFSIAIKSLQGAAMYSDAAPAYRQKWRTHKEVGAAIALVKKGDPRARKVYVEALEKFAERMVDVFEVETPHVILAEGAPAMSGDGFQVLFPSAEAIADGGRQPGAGRSRRRAAARPVGSRRPRRRARRPPAPRRCSRSRPRGSASLTKPPVTGDGAGLLAQRRPARFYAMGDFVVDDVTAAEDRSVHAADVPAMDGVIEPIWDRAGPPLNTLARQQDPHVSRLVRFLWSTRGLHVL